MAFHLNARLGSLTKMLVWLLLHLTNEPPHKAKMIFKFVGRASRLKVCLSKAIINTDVQVVSKTGAPGGPVCKRVVHGMLEKINTFIALSITYFLQNILVRMYATRTYFLSCSKETGPSVIVA